MTHYPIKYGGFLIGMGISAVHNSIHELIVLN